MFGYYIVTQKWSDIICGVHGISGTARSLSYYVKTEKTTETTLGLVVPNLESVTILKSRTFNLLNAVS